MFTAGDVYESLMGRFSRTLARPFLEFTGAGDGEAVLDVGCGTGSLASTLARYTRVAKVVGIDPSAVSLSMPRLTTAILALRAGTTIRKRFV